MMDIHREPIPQRTLECQACAGTGIDQATVGTCEVCRGLGQPNAITCNKCRRKMGICPACDGDVCSACYPCDCQRD